MEVECKIITIQIDIDEWKKVKKEWDEIYFADNPKKFEIKDNRSLCDFFGSIESVSNNPSHKIDRKLNSH